MDIADFGGGNNVEKILYGVSIVRYIGARVLINILLDVGLKLSGRGCCHRISDQKGNGLHWQ